MDPYAQIEPSSETDSYAPPAKRQRPTESGGFEDEVVTLKEKVVIPVDKYPGFNFVGAIIGPQGSILRELCKSTRSKIAVSGRGSMRDKTKEEELSTSEDPEHAHLKEPLHVQIEIKAPRAQGHIRMSQALLEVYRLIVPPGEGNQHHQFNQGPFDGYGFGGPPRGRGGPYGGRGGPPRGAFRGRGRGGGGPRGGF